jgi:hypothetical protein
MDFRQTIYYNRTGNFAKPEGVDFSGTIQVSSKSDLDGIDLSMYNPEYLEYFLQYLK